MNKTTKRATTVIQHYGIDSIPTLVKPNVGNAQVVILTSLTFSTERHLGKLHPQVRDEQQLNG